MSLLLMDGDTVQIASRSKYNDHFLGTTFTCRAEFECVHVLCSPQRAHFFDPTPRSDEVMKTKVSILCTFLAKVVLMGVAFSKSANTSSRPIA